MARNSEARAAVRSLLPESYLIQRHDVGALKYKYHASLAGSWENRWKAWEDLGCWEAVAPDFTPDYCKDKHFDGLSVECRYGSPVSAVDPQSDARIRLNKKDATLLHVSHLSGVHHFRAQLAATAEYIQANAPLRRTKYVAGATYREMARLVMALGFREMEIEKSNETYERMVRAAHMAYCAVNGKNAEFQLAAVFLPTEEFVHTFRPVRGSELLIASS